MKVIFISSSWLSMNVLRCDITSSIYVWSHHLRTFMLNETSNSLTSQSNRVPDDGELLSGQCELAERLLPPQSYRKQHGEAATGLWANRWRAERLDVGCDLMGAELRGSERERRGLPTKERSTLRRTWVHTHTTLTTWVNTLSYCLWSTLTHLSNHL